MTFGKSIKPAPKAESTPSPIPPVEPTLLQKVNKELARALDDLRVVEREVSILQRDKAWLEAHPEADRIFRSIMSIGVPDGKP